MKEKQQPLVLHFDLAASFNRAAFQDLFLRDYVRLAGWTAVDSLRQAVTPEFPTWSRFHTLYVPTDTVSAENSPSQANPPPPGMRVNLGKTTLAQVGKLVEVLRCHWHEGGVSVVADLEGGGKVTIDLPPAQNRAEVTPELRQWAKEQSTTENIGLAMVDIKHRGRVNLGDKLAEYKEKFKQRRGAREQSS